MEKHRAYAKVNLNLSVLGKNDNGYHDLEMIVSMIDLHDTLYFRELKEDKIVIEGMDIPIETNLIYKTIKLIKELYYIEKGVYVKIKKRIPSFAGLGGGSSDAATTLKYLNCKWKLNLTDEQLISLASKLGSDVPFFIKGGTCLVEKTGEKVTPVASMNLKFGLIIPEFKLSTKEVFANVKRYSPKNRTKMMIAALEKSDYFGVLDSLYNDLEEASNVVSSGGVIEIKNNLLTRGFIKTLMTGSGSAIMVFSENRNHLKKAMNEIKKIEKFIVSTKKASVYKKK